MFLNDRLVLRTFEPALPCYFQSSIGLPSRGAIVQLSSWRLEGGYYKHRRLKERVTKAERGKDM